MSEQAEIVGIDIGTSKIRVVSDQGRDEVPSCKAVFEYLSKGLARGRIVDIDRVTEALESAIRAAETELGSEIREVVLNVSTTDVRGIVGRGSLIISRFSHRVTEWDVVRVLELARQNIVPDGTDVICAVPRSFFIDGQVTHNPIGERGNLLEVDTLLITVPEEVSKGYRDIARRLGLKIFGMNSASVAAAGAVLASEEKGVALVDIGAGSTDIALFDSHGLCWLTSLPLGGDYITSDIAFGLQVSWERAEEIKVKYGTLRDDDILGKYFIVDGEDGSRKVNFSFLQQIVESRLEELLQLIRDSILESGFSQSLVHGVVFTGGVVKTPGFAEWSAGFLKVPVRIGVPVVPEVQEHLQDPALCSSLGLILCSSPDAPGDMQNSLSPIERIQQFIRELF